MEHLAIAATRFCQRRPARRFSRCFPRHFPHHFPLTGALRCATAVAAMAVAAPVAQAATELRLWHSLQGAHQTALETLVAQFQAETPAVQVRLQGYDSPAQLQAAAQALARSAAPAALPHLMQVTETHAPASTSKAASKTPIWSGVPLYPLYQLLTDAKQRQPDWFLPESTQFGRDARGRMLALPLMAEVPVMFYNLAAWRTAGLAEPATKSAIQPAAPTWPALQAALLALRAHNTLCPYLSSQQVAVHMENLAAVNHKRYVKPASGRGAKASPATVQVDTLLMRHLSLMASWRRAALLTHSSPGHEASVRFANGDCGVLMAASSAWAELRLNPDLPLAVAGLPYYPQESAQAAPPFVSGAALWAVAGHPREHNRAMATFLAWLASPEAAARWHQQTGFLPLTRPAQQAKPVGAAVFTELPGAVPLINGLRRVPATSRGFQLAQYPAVADILQQSFEAIMTHHRPPVQALNDASKRIQALLQARR